MKDSNLNEKSGSLLFFSLYIKMSETTYCQRNRETILNRAKEYYKNDKERLAEKQKDKSRKLSEEEKNIKREHERYRYHNMSKEKKQISKKISWSQ